MASCTLLHQIGFNQLAESFSYRCTLIGTTGLSNDAKFRRLFPCLVLSLLSQPCQKVQPPEVTTVYFVHDIRLAALRDLTA